MSQIAGSTESFDFADALGSTTMARSATGSLLWRRDYDAYGQETCGSSGAPADKRSFRWNAKSGYVTDEESGMQLLGHRYYLPRLGRFLTQDPIGQAGGLNLYAYCDNGPLLRVDPDGKDWTDRPGFWEGIIPIWGSGRMAINDFHEGRPEWGVANTLLAGLDVFLVKSIVQGVLKAGAKTAAQGSAKALPAVRLFRNSQGFLTDGKYFLDTAAMLPHTSGSLKAGKSQFLHKINAGELAMQGARYADQHGLWKGTKATIEFTENIGVHGSSGQLTRRMNIYRTLQKSPSIHASPASPR